MNAIKDLEIHYALDDLEGFKTLVTNLQVLIASAEQHPSIMPSLVEAMDNAVMVAMRESSRRMLARIKELDKLQDELNGDGGQKP